MFGWKEVWMGGDIDAFFQRQNALRDNGLLFKSKTSSNGARFFVGRAAVSRVRDTYYLYVKEPDAQKAHALFLQLCKQG